MVQSCCGVLSLLAGVRVIGALNIALGLIGALYPSVLPYIHPLIVCSTTPESVISIEMWYSSSLVNTFDKSEYVLRGLSIGFGVVAIGATYIVPGRLLALTWFILFMICYAIARLVWNLYLAFSSLGYHTILTYWGNPTDSSSLYTAGVCVNANQRLALVESSLLLLIYLYSVRVLTSYIDSLDYNTLILTSPRINTEDQPMVGRPLSTEEAGNLDLEQLQQSGHYYQGESVIHP